MTIDEFVRQHIGTLGRVAGALTRDRHEAEELLAESLLRIVTKWRRVSGADKPVAYAKQIVCRTYVDRLRKQNREAFASSHSFELERPHFDPPSREESRQEVELLLARLTPAERTVVVCKFVLDQTDEEIARMMRCKPSTVRSHLSHARQTLRLPSDTERSKDQR